MRLYGLKNCDTCRKALKSLADAGCEIDFVDVRATPLSADVLTRFEAAHGDALVNRRSTTWRGLDDDARARPAVELLLDHPTLMKRPVIEVEGKTYLGWNDAVRSAVMA